MIDTFKRNYLLIVILGIASTWALGALIISIIEPENLKILLILYGGQ